MVLKEYGDLNYKEIGRALGISEGNVKVRVFRARERLAGFLNAETRFALCEADNSGDDDGIAKEGANVS
jgi:predicted DNA-binding protein (UPF0251 family)